MITLPPADRYRALLHEVSELPSHAQVPTFFQLAKMIATSPEQQQRDGNALPMTLHALEDAVMTRFGDDDLLREDYDPLEFHPELRAKGEKALSIIDHDDPERATLGLLSLVERIATDREEYEANRYLLPMFFNELRHQVTELAGLAYTDPLTKAKNRKAYEEQVPREIATARRYNGHLAFLMVDLDYFKLRNDQHGHPVGDEILKTFVVAAKGHIRDTDSVYRIGGEEFALALSGSEKEGAVIVDKKIRQAFARELFQRNLPDTTLSVGGAFYADDVRMMNDYQHKPVDQLFLQVQATADKRLYIAKAMGRDRSVFEGPVVQQVMALPAPSTQPAPEPYSSRVAA